MIELGTGIDLYRPDATFDLDGTVFKLTIIEEYTRWLSDQGIFETVPDEIILTKQIWKEENTEANYKAHLDQLVEFFIDQVQGKSINSLAREARAVAEQQMHRRWNITVAIINHLRDTHNIIAISHMPEWLMESFAGNLGFTALIGSTYVEHEGVYTGEAQSIDKGEAYKATRHNALQFLDIHMGDTVGDASQFTIARRPILFNPSATLINQRGSTDMTVITSHKDVVTVLNPVSADLEYQATIWTPPFNVPAILAEIQTQEV